jgi:hypothetical protein
MSISATMRGGEQMEAKLRAIATKLQGAKAVRVGFFDSATYPAGDGGARLADAANRARKEGHADWAGLFYSWSAWQAAHPRTLHVAQVAFWNEFGTSRAPARPFFRMTIRREQGHWAQDLSKLLKANEFDAKKSLGLLGLEVKEEIQQTITEWPADNAPMTVFIKGFNKGLTDSSIMAHSVDFEVN